MAHNFIGLPADGAGKKLHTHTISDGSHNQIFTLGDPAVDDNLQYVDTYGAAYVRFAEGNQIFDSFGKTKMSQETLVGEYMPRYDSLPDTVSTITSGTASELYLPNEASIRLQTGTADGDLIQRTSHKYHKYFPGTSQLVEFTVALGDTGKDNVVRQWGYYDDENGVIFKVNGSLFEIVLRSSTTGSVIDTVISQADFNIDKADGTGVSELLMDPSKANIYWLDLQYLGVGRIRIGAYAPSGQRITFHQIENANSEPGVYMSTASLPLRWEQFNVGISTSTSEMKVLNAAVYTEAQEIETKGKCFSTAEFGTLPTPLTTKADGTFDSLVSIRPKATFNGKTNRSIIIPQHLLINTNKPLQISIMLDVNNGGVESWNSVNEWSRTEKAGSLTFVDIGSGNSMYCTMSEIGVKTYDLGISFDYFREFLHLNADGTQPTYTVILRTLDGTSATVSGGLTWTELII